MKYVSIVLFFVLIPLFLCASDKARVSYRVICDDATVLEKMTGAFSARISEEKDIELSDEYPKAKLFVYAQQDINDRKNPAGWSLAIAHVCNIKGLFLAAKLIDNQDEGVEAVKPVLVDMVKEEGFLQYLNVAHLDEMTDATLKEAVDIIVANFAGKVNGNTSDSSPE